MKKRIKLIICDVDGTLTDGKIYLSASGEESKCFSCKDGAIFHHLKHYFAHIKIAWITSELQGVNLKRFEKLRGLGTVHDYIDGVHGKGKLEAIIKLCDMYNITYENVAYIGDGLNDYEPLLYVAVKGCPKDADKRIKRIKGMKVLKSNGGDGAVKEFVEWMIRKGYLNENS